MFWKNLMVGQNLMVGHALLGGWKWSELPCSVIWHLLVIILMHWVFQFWLWGRFVAEKQTWVLILMSGHRPEMTYYENGEKKVCELDHYTDQSYLGIHYWDLVSKVAYPKLKKNWNSNVQTWETVKIWGDVPCTFILLEFHLLVPFNVIKGCCVKEDVHSLQRCMIKHGSWKQGILSEL